MDIPLDTLLQLAHRPAPFEPGTAVIWTDPHISTHLLAAHLDDTTEAASRSAAVIDATVAFWLSSGLVRPGMRLLDLGCGPGLYARRLARAGLRVTGIDQSERSLAYARARAEAEGFTIEYRQMDFLDLDEQDTYDVAIQVYGELNTFSDEARDKLLSVVRRSLLPGGKLLLDLSTRTHRARVGSQNRWWAAEGGFWSPGAHVVLEQGFDDPGRSLWVDQTAVLDASGIRVFRNWFHDYEPDGARAFLAAAGMQMKHLWNDLAGTPYQAGGEWFALCAEVEK